MKEKENTLQILKKQITELKAEKSMLANELNSMKETKERFLELFEATPLPYQSLDENGKIIEVNTKWLEEFQYEKNEVINHPLAEFIAPEYLEKLSNDFQKFKETGVIENLEQVIVTKNGKKIDVIADGKACSDDEGKFWHTHCILRKVTDLKKIQDELRQTIIQKDKFFSIIAHDLKNPIIGFVGLTKILYEDFSAMTLTGIYELIETINKSAYGLNELLENLLEWSRLQRGVTNPNPIKFNLKDLVDNTTIYLKSNLDFKKIKAINEVDEKINVFADVNMISSVVNNLISNAFKFSFENSKIIISSEIINDFVAVSIQDFGIGIEEKNINKLFKLDEQFISLGTAKEKGTGLGLILCKEHIEKHRGEIKVNSKLNEGSNFTFTLPLHPKS